MSGREQPGAAFAIGIVCFPSFGGSGVIASELAMGLSERGHRVHLIAAEPPGRFVASEGEGWHGVTFHRVEVPPYPLFEHGPYELALASRLLDVAREERLDLVQVHYAVPHAPAAVLARHLLGPGAFRIVTSLHGTDVTRVGADPAYRSAIAASVAASDGITTPSDFLRKEAYARLGIGADVPIEVLPNFVDTDRFAPPAQRDRRIYEPVFGGPVDGPVLVHVSNFRSVKRTGDLVDVMQRLRASLPARMVLIGDGPERAGVERRARALGLGESMAFVGNQADFLDLLRHADAFVLPSESESFGVAAIEAASCGVPVFAYRVGGLPEVVEPAMGRLVEPYDVEALADAIGAELAAPQALAALGRSARESVLARYRRGPSIERWEAFFRGVLETVRKEGG